MAHYTILDTRGLLLRDYHGTNYKSVEAKDGKIPSWKDGLASFVERTLLPLLRNVPPRQVIACWDGGNEFRRLIFPSYKQKRRERDSDPVLVRELNELQEQARRLMAYCGIRSVSVPGEEADDLIALFCERLPQHHLRIQTRDEDLLQLVSPTVIVQRENDLYSLDGFGSSTHKGLPLRFIRLYKSICGDASDEYPGVRGMAEKAFQQLREQFGDDGLEQLEAIVASGDAAALRGTGEKLLDKLYEQFQEWRLSYRLAQLHPEVCYGQRNGSAKRPVWHARVPNQTVVLGLLEELHLADRFHEIAHWFPTERLITADQSQVLIDLMPAILKSEIVSYDFESSDKQQWPNFREAGSKDYVDVLAQELAGISINFGANLEQTIYVPFDHASTQNFGLDWAKWILLSLNQRADRPVVQNAAFELAVAKKQLDLDLVAPYDTAIMASYVDENDEAHLKDNSLQWLNYRQKTYKETTQGRAMWELTGEEVLSYGCDDSLVTSHLFDIKRLILQLEGTWEFYVRYEVDPIQDDVRTFIDGTDIDLTLMKKLQQEAAQRRQAAAEALQNGLREYAQTGSVEDITPRAKALLDNWWEFDEHKYKGDTEKAQVAYQALWQKAWEGCFYTPPTREQVQVTFSPTLTQLERVRRLIGPRLPAITKLTKAALEQWGAEALAVLAEWEDELRSALSTTVLHQEEDVDPFEAASEFVAALLKAQAVLGPSKRQGPAYDRLATICQEVLSKAAFQELQINSAINWNSSVQMTTFLYGKLGLPIRRRSKVTRGSQREKLKLKGPAATGLKAIAAALVYDVTEKDDWRYDMLMDYRTICLLQQEDSLYYKKYPLWVHPESGKLHPQIRNCGTVTRRPSGSSPNVLQVSKKDGAKIRKCYVGGDYGDGERVYVSADFAGQELVITACESRDPVMLDAFMSSPRKDLHSLTATSFAHTLLAREGIDHSPFSYEEMLSILHGEQTTLSTKLKEIRNKYAKPANFLIVYGGGHTTLAENLLIAEDLAKEIMDSTFRLYSRLQPWQEETIQKALKQGYIETAYGNRKHVTKMLYSDDKKERSREGRQAVNFTIQSTAADILKVVRQEMFRRQLRERYNLKAIKPVYDEISASVPVGLAADYARELVEVMSITPPGYPVGMQVDVSIGKTWGSVIEFNSDKHSSYEDLVNEAVTTNA